MLPAREKLNMERDLLLKRYLCDNDRFADLLNGIVGEQLVEPESLTELDTQTGVLSVLRNRFGRNKRQGYRDLLKKAAFGINFLVVGIENQESVHYLMPLRCMSYRSSVFWSMTTRCMYWRFRNCKIQMCLRQI